jgi:hypothetical protein
MEAQDDAGANGHRANAGLRTRSIGRSSACRRLSLLPPLDVVGIS